MVELEQNLEGVLDALLSKPYHKILRITAYVYRFIYRTHENDTLTPEEIQNAEKFWIKHAQKSIDFDSDYNLKKTVDGIYLISGRIRGYSPILIPKVHPIAKSLVQNAHRKTLHGGAAAIICEVRKRFWIPQLRKLAKNIVHNCERCKRYRVKPLEPP